MILLPLGTRIENLTIRSTTMMGATVTSTLIAGTVRNWSWASASGGPDGISAGRITATVRILTDFFRGGYAKILALELNDSPSQRTPFVGKENLNPRRRSST